MRERTLEQQLAALARLLWADRMRQYQAARADAFGQHMAESPPATATDRAYDEARDALVAEGRSSDGRLSITVRGMRAWSVRIAAGTVASLDERAFVDQVQTAAAALIEDQLAGIGQLKREIYGR